VVVAQSEHPVLNMAEAEAVFDDSAEVLGPPRADSVAIPVGPAHPGAELFWPVPGMALGFGDGFIIAVRDLLASIAEGRPAEPGFVDGLRASAVVAAAQASAVTHSWQTLDRLDLAEA
jgi:hypothetical protein